MNPFKERGSDENQEASLKDSLHVPVGPMMQAMELDMLIIHMGMELNLHKTFVTS
jgi:hypothetical protein